MKWIGFLFVATIVTRSAAGQVEIRGYILDSAHSRITLFEPINDFCNRDIAPPESEVKTDHNHYFERQIDLHKTTMVTLQIGMNVVWLTVEPQDTIDLWVDVDKFTTRSPNGGLVIKGKNGAGNQLFNYFNFQPGRKFGLFFDILDSLHFRKNQDLHSTDIALAKIFAPFDSLLARKAISTAFYEVVVGDMRGAFVTDICSHELSQDGIDVARAVSFVDKLYAKYPVSYDMMRAGLNSRTTAYFYYYSRIRGNYLTKDLADSICTVNGKQIFINRDMIPWLYAEKPLCEIYWFMDLIIFKKLFSDAYGERDAASFISYFPNSPLNRYLHPPYYGSVTYFLTRSDSTKIKFLDSTGSTNLDSVIASSFKGKKVLVDIWATWCVPCKQEFPYNAGVDSFCAKHDIRRLYIALEQPITKPNVNKNIFAYGLEGSHIIANPELIQDLNRRYSTPQNPFTIPRYILINEKGTIVNSDAPRPSSEGKLFDAMRAAFNFKE